MRESASNSLINSTNQTLPIFQSSSRKIFQSLIFFTSMHSEILLYSGLKLKFSSVHYEEKNPRAAGWSKQGSLGCSLCIEKSCKGQIKYYLIYKRSAQKHPKNHALHYKVIKILIDKSAKEYNLSSGVLRPAKVVFEIPTLKYTLSKNVVENVVQT